MAWGYRCDFVTADPGVREGSSGASTVVSTVVGLRG